MRPGLRAGGRALIEADDLVLRPEARRVEEEGRQQGEEPGAHRFGPVRVVGPSRSIAFTSTRSSRAYSRSLGIHNGMARESAAGPADAGRRPILTSPRPVAILNISSGIGL